jgi:hypothetical protein
MDARITRLRQGFAGSSVFVRRSLGEGGSPGMTSRCCFNISIPATHFGDLATHGARGMPINSRPLRNKGAGNAGRPMRPAVSCARWSRKRTRAYRSHRNHPALPAQWFYGLYRALPGAPGVLATVAPERLSLPGNLTPASGYQDHTILPYTSGAFVKGAIRVHRSPPRERDDRVSPLLWDGMAENIG